VAAAQPASHGSTVGNVILFFVLLIFFGGFFILRLLLSFGLLGGWGRGPWIGGGWVEEAVASAVAAGFRRRFWRVWRGSFGGGGAGGSW